MMNFDDDASTSSNLSSTPPVAPPLADFSSSTPFVVVQSTTPVLRPLGEPQGGMDSPVREWAGDGEAPMTPMRTPARSQHHLQPPSSSSRHNSSFSLSSPLPFSPSAVLSSSYHQASDAIESANTHVSAIASNYMLMEYAAQIKGMSQLKVVRSVKRLKNIPREVVETASMVKAEAVRVLALIRAHIEEIASGRQAQKAKLEQIKNSHSFLQAATELLNQAEVETVREVRKRRQSQRQSLTMTSPPPDFDNLDTSSPSPSPSDSFPSPSPAAQDAVSSLASLMAAMKAAPASAAMLTTPTASSSPLASSSPSSTADAAKINELASLVQALSAQMAALKAASSTPAPAMPLQAPGGAVASIGPSIPMAPRQSSTPRKVAAPVVVPQAPELRKDSFWYTGVHRDQEEETSEDAEDGENIPPPSSDSSPSTAAAKPLPPSRSGILGEITNRTAVLKPVGERPVQRKRLSQRSQSVIDQPVTAKPVIQCYTRRLPGGETMSLTDSIKMASKIKLRRTEQDRSPGGTPRKDPTVSRFTSGSTQDVLQAALQARFKNVHAMEGAMVKQQQQQLRSQSVILTSTPLQSVHELSTLHKPQPLTHVTKRTSVARLATHGRRNSIDKENWETS